MKIKKMADGGTTPGSQQPTYPFYGNQQTQATTTPRVVQNVNIPQPGFPLSQPANTLNQQPTAMKKGGKGKRFGKGGTVAIIIAPKVVDKKDKFPTRPDDKYFPDQENAPSPDEGYRGTKKLAKGGSASSRADGIAQRGKTRGKFV